MVVVGLYRFVRNPMYLAVLTIVLGWSLAFRSAWLGLYLVALAIGFHLRVVLYEEPWLQRQFGAEWQTYLGNVGRWVPRLKADHRNRFRVVLAVCVGVVVCGVTWGVFGQREPVSAGHKIGFWINRLGGLSPNLAVQNVQRTGSGAVPYLMKAVERQPSPIQRSYHELWPQLPLWAKTCLPHPLKMEQLRWNAAIVLGRIGSDARPAIPALIRAMQNDENYNVRWFAITALGQIARNDKIVSDAVVRALQDSNMYVRMAATNVLAKIDSEAAAKAGVK